MANKHTRTDTFFHRNFQKKFFFNFFITEKISFLQKIRWVHALTRMHPHAPTCTCMHISEHFSTPIHKKNSAHEQIGTSDFQFKIVSLNQLEKFAQCGKHALSTIRYTKQFANSWKFQAQIVMHMIMMMSKNIMSKTDLV